MTLKERIKNGMIFYEDGHTDPEDIRQERELEEQRRRCKEAMFDFNSTRPGEDEKRTAILKGLLAECPDHVFLETPAHMSYGSHVHLGDYFYANFNLVIIDDTDVYIGDRVLVGPNVTICATGHPVYPLYRELAAHYSLPIRIGNCVWIGANSVILPGVKIGDNTVIGAGSVVTKDIPDNVVAVGNPCRVLREITEKDREYYFRDRKVDFAYTLRNTDSPEV
ncbi:MAG TPA: galactoside O-acetyltransferase [Candidatus Blautia merdavium]|uniref:Acetyltransferase n=1 Tax=Candidatus Blautia merdavium TaxID=2838494 RepID=A0A9D2TBG6_9FIRM|nr:galactoside O-acetyltransferase [Candidatus Blautia merdavium]